MSEGHLSLVQNQQLRISPQMLRSMQLLRQPILELLQSIHQELEDNPALEVLEELTSLSLNAEETNEGTETEFSGDEPSLPPPPSAQSVQLSRPESLHEHLLWQLRLEELSPLEFCVGEQLIDNLDEDGFHIHDPHDFLKEEKIFTKMILLIRGFDPVGTCVKDFRESLLVQAQMRGDVPSQLPKLISELFDPEDPHSLQHSDVPEAELTQCLEFLKKLTPFPGRQYSTAELQYLLPDATITVKSEQVVVLPNKHYLPRLGINSFFEKSIRNGSSEVKRFARHQVARAREFLQSIALRESSTELIIGMVVRFQEEFFRKGSLFLKPLTMKRVAEELKISESTVSRVVNGRYIQTDWGVFLLRYFFSTAGVSQSNTKILPGIIKGYITEILTEKGSISDQKLTGYLMEKDIRIARRTVAKYRKELGLTRRRKYETGNKDNSLQSFR